MAEDPRFPGLADFREQAALLAEAGVDLIALEMIDARGYGRAAVQAAAETGLPVWLGISVSRRDDGTVDTLPELGDGDSLEDLLTSLADPALAAVTVMHSKPDVVPDAIEIIRRHFAGPVGVYADGQQGEPAGALGRSVPGHERQPQRRCGHARDRVSALVPAAVPAPQDDEHGRSRGRR